MTPTTRTALALAAACCLTPVSNAADDLRSLIADYRGALKQIGGAPKDRLEKARKDLSPLLEKIGRVDSEESVGFLAGEFRNPPVPEVAAVCVRPLVGSSASVGIQLVLAEFPRVAPVVQQAILDALAETKKDIAPFESEILSLTRQRLRSEVLPSVPRVLGKLDTVEAAKAVLGHLQDTRGRRGDSEARYRSAALDALKTTKSAAVKSWLAGDAFVTAGSDAARLDVLLRTIGALKLAGARRQVIERLTHPSSNVAVAAADALAQVGIGDAVEDLSLSLQRRKGGDLKVAMGILDALAASGDSTALRVVIDVARGNEPELRVAALASLGLVAGKSKDALNVLLKALKDPDTAARAVALRAVSRARDKAMIVPLIDAMEAEDDYSFRVKVLELLVALTGQNMGLVPADWRKWWDIAEARFEFPKEGEESFTSVKKLYDLEYFGIEISSKRLTFICDISSSMNQEVAVKPHGTKGPTGGETRGGGEVKASSKGKARKIEVLKKELERVIEKLPPDTHINIITFDAEFGAWQKQLQPMSGSGRGRAIQFVRSIRTGVGTNVFDTLEHALEDKRVDTIYLLTDGEPTRGRITEPAAILREVDRLNRLRAATVHCIAFGAESEFLENLAQQNGGKYRFVNEY